MGVVLPVAIVLLVGGVIGGGLALVDGTLDPGGDAVRAGETVSSGGNSGLILGFAGHTAEPFVPCSSNVLDCFSKADLAYRAGSRWGSGSVAGLGTRQPRATRSRFIPGRDETAQPGFLLGIDPLDAAVSAPLSFLAEEIAPFTGGASGSAAQSQRFDIFPQNGGIGGIGGEVIAIPVPTPTPTPEPTPTTTPTPSPTTMPPMIETPVSAVPEPATWLQMLIGFAIVGAMLRWHRGRRGARQFS